MNLHEYQAKHLFETYQMPVPENTVVWNAEQAIEAAKNLGGDKWVVKAQVHAGGRGKAGGVEIVSNTDELHNAVQHMIGSNLVTYQTDEHGQPVNQVLVEKPSDIQHELYVGAVIDRANHSLAIMASTEGGVEIEEVAKESPEKILQVEADPMLGLQPYQCRQLAFGLGLDASQLKPFTKMLTQMAKMFIECDMSLLEINPLVLTGQGELLCLDAKVNIDGNALYRQPELREMRDPSQEDERENRAQNWDLNYIALDGNIGCMVNGAGLAMATMDLIKLYGGEPANFLDVGGSATQERVREAFKIILSDDSVQAVLVNIFGGIVRCDLIAEGIINAVSEVGINVPVVVRLEGNNADVGAKKLEESEFNLIAAQGFADAAERVVNEAKQTGASA